MDFKYRYRNYHLISLIIFLANCIDIQLARGQVDSQDDFFSANLMTPQAFNFTKYGNEQVSFQSGQANVQVPIYTYEDKDFDIPVLIRYSSPGFIPNQREGVIGLGWYLDAGGAITRVVNGVPDDSRSERSNLSYDMDGLLYGVKNNLPVKTATKTSLFNLTVGNVTSNLFWNVGYSEVNPDLFSFNVPGLTGKFYIQNNGEARCIGSKPFKVDYSNVSIQYLGSGVSSDVLSSSFIITTDDGYEYRFGGTISFLDVVFHLNGNDEVTNPLINAWHLTKITAPNGRTVEFYYDDFIKGFYNDDEPKDSYHYLYNINSVRIQSSNPIFFPGDAYYESSSSGAVDMKSATKATFLKSIVIDGRASVIFNYAEKKKLFYTDIIHVNDEFNQKNYSLRTIEIFDFSGNRQKKFDLTQTYYGGQYRRMFLTSFQEVGANPYTFTYYDTTNLPDPLTGSVDHWGFWNGNGNQYQATIPDITYQTNGDVEITGTQRDVNTSKCKTSMLKQITYPTMGYSRFYYEPHDFRKKLDRRSDFNFLPKLYPEGGYTGGARIAKIEEFDGERNMNVREFKYLNDYPSGTQSSGILMQWPRYLFYWEINGSPGGSSKNLKIRNTSFNSSYSGIENYIGYSEVTVVQPGIGYTNYKFTDYESNPDENNYNTLVLDPPIYSYISNKDLYNSYVGIKFNDKYFERGIPWRIGYYRSNGTSYVKVKEVETSAFTNSSDFPDNYVVGVQMTGGVAQSFKRYFYPFLPKTVKETTYNEQGANPIVTRHDYQYNAQGYLSKEFAPKSDGDTLVTILSYPAEYMAGNGFIDDMRNRNILSIPIEKVTFKKLGAQSEILTGSISTYKPGGEGLPDQLLELETDVPVSQSNFKFSNRTTGILPPTGNPGTFLPDDRYSVRVSNESFDNYGNVTSLNKYDAPTTAYIWGYQGAYLTASVTNATRNNVFYTSFEDTEGNSENGDSKTGNRSRIGGYAKSLTGLKNGDYILSYWKKSGDVWDIQRSGVHVSSGNYPINLTGQIDEVRFYPSDAQMKTYTYDPLIGMTSQCGVDDQVTYYEYDDNGRLAAIRDQNRNIVKRICYNYAGQQENCMVRYYNKEKSGSFTRNNCVAGYDGTSIFYIVPDSTYSSTESPETADQMAVDDVNANGQTYANAQANCIPIEIPVTIKNTGANGNQTFYVTFTGLHTFKINNKAIVGGDSYTKDIYWGTYDVEIEVKSGDVLNFSLNGAHKEGSIVTFTNVSITDSTMIYAGAFWNTTQYVSFTRNNCPEGYTPSVETYTVPAGIIASFTSQADANQLAIEASSVAGQNYANNNGVCYSPPSSETELIYTSHLSKTIKLKLTSYSTGIVYNFSLTYHTSPTSLGTIPVGIYDAVMTAKGHSDYYSINNYVQSISDTDLNITNVYLTTDTTIITAY